MIANLNDPLCIERSGPSVRLQSDSQFEEMVEDGDESVILYEDGEAFFKDTVEGDVDGFWEGELDAGIYVFYCPACDRYLAQCPSPPVVSVRNV